jgi:hypothetical protein
MPESTLAENLEAVLRRCGKIWIWSILSQFPAFQSMAGAIGGPRNNLWTPLAVFWAFVPSPGTLAAVYFLLQLLRHNILPILFPPPAQTEAFVEPTAPAQTVPNGANLLYGAFASIVAALALEAVGVLDSIVYRAIAA